MSSLSFAQRIFDWGGGMDLVGEEDAGAGEIIPKQALYVKKT